MWLDRLCKTAPTTRKGQHVYMVTMLVIPMLPIVALIIQNCYFLNDVVIYKDQIINVDAGVSLTLWYHIWGWDVPEF